MAKRGILDMSTFKNRYRTLHTKSLKTIFYEHMKLGLFVYIGCLTGYIFIPYLLGDHTVLDKLGSLSIQYMLGTLIPMSISLGIILFKRSKLDKKALLK